MCPTSSFRCGSCLSKWNGKSWEESFKCVLPVKSWSLVLNKKYELCIEGLCDINSNLAVCIPVTERLNSYWVSNDCTLVKLRGILNTKELPEYVAKKFAHGIPTNWKEIVNKWVEFVQRGEKSSFSWEQDESFDSCNTSFLVTRSRRISSGKNTDGKVKEKIQRTSPNANVIEQERDSALPTSEDCSTKVDEIQMPPPIWNNASPQLPAHKVKEIFQWIDIAHLSKESLDVEKGCSDTSEKFVAPTSGVLNPKTKVLQKSSNPIPQSTPQIPVRNAQLISSEELQWNISSVYSNSSLNHSVTINSMASQLFGKSNLRNRHRKNSPKNVTKIPPSHFQSICEEVPSSGKDSSLDRSLINLASENVFRKPTRGRPPETISKTLPGKVSRHNSKNAEVPGSRMGRMLSSSLRPRRRQTLQKIERWRPVLGVDGCLKVQGYLLLQCDMTAGQILTTNNVVEWGERRVVTCDGREYLLVGDPSGKIPGDLKSQLLKPMECADIVAKLMRHQALKDRSDWGAEYEVFYGSDDVENVDGRGETSNVRNTRTSNNVKNNTRMTSRNTSRQKLKSAAQTVNSQEPSTCVTGPPTSGKSRSTNRKTVASGSIPSAELNSGSSLQTPNSNHNTPGLNQSVNNCSNKVDRNSLNLTSSHTVQEKKSGAATVNKSLTVLSNNQQDKENDCIGGSSTDTTRSCFENITWKNTQNQMMMPSPRLSADSSNVDFSSSRIKVSYINPGSKTNKNSPEFRSRNLVQNESFSSNEGTPKSRPSRSPLKRACLPCLQNSKSPMASRSPHSPLSRTRRTTIPEKATQANSRSSVRNQAQASSVPQTRSGKKTPMQVTKTPVEKRDVCDSLQSSSRRTPKITPKCSSPPKSLRSSARANSRQLRVVVQRMDTRKSFPNAHKLSSQKKLTPSSIRGSKQTPLKALTKGRKEIASSARKIPYKNVNKNKKEEEIKNQKDEEKNKNKKDEEKNKNKKDEEKNKNKKDEEKNKKKKNEENNGNKVEEKRSTNRNKNKSKNTSAKKITSSAEESTDKNDDDADAASVCSSDSSVGPSASIIFQLNNSPVSRRKPRTLKERRERDAQIAEIGKKLAAKKTIGLDADDDPMADLIAAHKFSPLPQEWCRHENLLGKSRKRRRPSSSDGTVSPSRSGLSEGFGNEDATSSVATPQLLMRPPDPKQVQSYLQRQRAWIAKPQRQTRQTKKGNDKLLLPHIDYAAVFRPDTSDSEEERTSEVSGLNSDWET